MHVPVKPVVRRIRPVANRDDPRFRRTRAQICAATLRLLDDTDASRLTFGQVASAAEVNRSTVHQHYASRHELVADAVAGELAAIAEPLNRCPFDSSGQVPTELVEMFAAATAHRQALTRLGAADSGLLASRLTDLLATQLADRFAVGARPGGFGAVPAVVHADYVAGGLVRLLLGALGAGGGSDDPTTAAGPRRLAEQAWSLIAPSR